jgi:hypothetical protein
MGSQLTGLDIRRLLELQTERAEMLVRRKEELYALLVRVALCGDVFAQLPADLQRDIRSHVGDLISKPTRGLPSYARGPYRRGLG